MSDDLSPSFSFYPKESSARKINDILEVFEEEAGQKVDEQNQALMSSLGTYGWKHINMIMDRLGIHKSQHFVLSSST